MIAEKIIFNLISIALFTMFFLKFVKKSDTSYITILTLQFLGITINFIEIFIAKKLSIYIRIIMYLLAIIIPLVILFLEKYKKMDFPEMFNLLMVHILYKTGNKDKAKVTLNNFIEKNGNSYSSHKYLGKIYEEEKNYEASIYEYIKTVELSQKDLSVFYCLANVYNLNKQNGEAIMVLQNVLKQKPEEIKATELLGDIYFEEERYKEAASLYMTAIKYHPGNYDLYYNLGMTYTMLNDFGKAKEYYNKAAELNTILYNAKLSIGQIELLYGELENAEKYFLECLKSDETEKGAYYYLSKIAMLKGDKEKAINYMKVAIELDANIYMQFKIDPIFVTIRNNIEKPKELIENEIEKNQEIINIEAKSNYKKKNKNKNKKVYNHLAKMNMLIENLSNEDLAVLKKSKINEKNKNIKQNKEKTKE